jgi:hypothetical protein
MPGLVGHDDERPILFSSANRTTISGLCNLLVCSQGKSHSDLNCTLPMYTRIVPPSNKAVLPGHTGDGTIDHTGWHEHCPGYTKSAYVLGAMFSS